MKFHLPALLCLVSVPVLMRGQDPNLAPDDLKNSREAFDKNHLIAQVNVPGKQLHYRYDRYAEVRRIQTDEGMEFAQPKGKAWRKSKDWGKTGTVIKGDKAAQLDNQAAIAEVPLAEPEDRDKTQGGPVWKLIDKTQENDIETFTYERSREKPRPDGVYPRFTFIKYKSDTDGKLLLYRFAGQLRMGDDVTPLQIQFGLMILLPATTVIEEVHPKKKSK
ncbi:MAG: hypothetical protein ABJF10_23615 [Chthoniobacter sp.]|uniref:hypothetical protein n=1 Tax=Chthoniobacter sp. TaxID=2510640 RepID=UPI0032AE2D0F